MGGGASTAVKNDITKRTSKEIPVVSKVFTDEIITHGCSLLREDELFASSFIDYLKSGAWLDRLKAYPCNETLITVTAENDNTPIYAQYNISTSQMSILEKNNWLAPVNDAASSPCRGSSRSHRSNRSTTSDIAEKCAVSGDCTCFSDTQLCNILLSVVYPMYMASSSHERFLRYGPQGSLQIESDSCSESTGNNIAALADETNPSRHAPLLLHNTAMRYDGAELMEWLKKENWTEQLTSSIDDHRLAVSVVNTVLSTQPFMYVNRAFEKMFGYVEGAVLGKSMSIIDSPFTERPLQILLQEALRKNTTTKLAITHKTSAKIPFLDLLAVRAVGAYSVCVHFAAKRGSNYEHLNMVDDFMMLIPYILKAPPAPCPAGNGKSSRGESFDSTMIVAALRSVFSVGSRSGSEPSVRSRHSFSIRSNGSAKSKSSVERSYTEAQILAASVGSPRLQPRLERIASVSASAKYSVSEQPLGHTKRTAEMESLKSDPSNR